MTDNLLFANKTNKFAQIAMVVRFGCVNKLSKYNVISIKH